jgi:hypothetical protein
METNGYLYFWVSEKSKVYFFIHALLWKNIFLITVGRKLWTAKLEKWPILRL